MKDKGDKETKDKRDYKIKNQARKIVDLLKKYCNVYVDLLV